MEKFALLCVQSVYCVEMFYQPVTSFHFLSDVAPCTVFTPVYAILNVFTEFPKYAQFQKFDGLSYSLEASLNEHQFR